MAQQQELFDQVKTWSEADFDDETRAEAAHLLARAEAGDPAAVAALEDAFSGRLEFGTAGLRGEVGAGPRRMNRVVVTQTSAGFAAYLHDRAARGETSTPPSIVIGYDGRTHSAQFARDAAEIMAGAGIRVTLMPEAGPTPLLAFAVRHLGTSAGVMVTASHNPPRDNGYKVYLGDADDGSQIIPPTDAEIGARIAEAATRPLADLPRSSEYAIADASVTDEYVAVTATSVVAGLPLDDDGNIIGKDVNLRVAYTAMHGVGADISRRVFSAAGLPLPVPVPEQETPDGRFPTVAFPNPEEPGALDLAFRTGREIQANIIIAHDPDADRLAVALPCVIDEPGFRRLTGNELGLLLGWRAAERELQRATIAGEDPRGALACTIVSSPALGAVAAAYGLDYVETLSGFKWVSRVPGLLFGYEEALGYLTHPEHVHDKDGISASADILALARECASRGIQLWDMLDEASARFGHFASTPITLRLASMAAATEMSARIRTSPPSCFGDRKVTRAQDLLEPGLAEVPANVLRYDLADGSRVMIRPSGTEPKLKLYLDTFSDIGSGPDCGPARREAAEADLAVLETDVRAYLAGLG
ncbi:phospho-sugar mutase [Leucobacter sp. cx-42]|uniref:phospho-sugar mutase n=1 Tax=unclassified Leucobacter TaxID=2621730 RepID=UPI00165D6EC1|nr:MULTISPECIES: phospho-sugar mutase [unclassified Leucobacter]MBC9953977.1 phospho-sugar mutase [Leucobacter sp. cx-42]